MICQTAGNQLPQDRMKSSVGHANHKGDTVTSVEMLEIGKAHGIVMEMLRKMYAVYLTCNHGNILEY